MKVGFIGLGIMGKPMAKNLVSKGYDLIVYDINKEAVLELCSCGAKGADTPCEIAENSDIIITMLPNSPQVEEVVLGDTGVIAGIKKEAIFIDMSSISPIVSKKISEKITKAGAYMLDAPVSGGEPKAIDATLSIMAGGDEKVFGKCKDLLLCMGASAVLCGKVGAGNVTKLANQIIVAANIAAVSEALVLAAKAGVDPDLVHKAIRGGLAGSTVLDAKGTMMLNRNFKPGFKIDLHIKDLNNVIDTAEEMNAPVMLTKEIIGYFKTLSSKGEGNSDHSALVKYYEELAGIEMGKDA